MSIVVRTAVSVLALALLGPVLHAAPQQADSIPGPSLPAGYVGPPAPVAPAVMTRDAEGRVTVRAVRVSEPLRLDGRLDEAIYATTPSLDDFLQQDPDEGAVATERTETWLLFDDENFYVVFRCHESRPETLVANEMRRDSSGIFQNDHIAFLLDPFYDRRNGLEFAVNPLGGRWDGQIANESQASADWNPVWEVAVGRFEGGWTAELAIPFKSIRYRPGRAQVWGFNARRVNRGKNEVSFLTRVSRAMGQRALFQASIAATVVGIEAPVASRNLELKPYAISSLTTNRAAVPPVSNDASADAGIDVKYGVTEGLTADFTYNTDFAQVEADEQQVNLTRFNLFFPEKREFFLENQGLFSFGGVGTGTGGVGTAAGGDTPILFYSRRIGFDAGRSVPIEAGGRLTGRVGRFSVGLLNIRSKAEVDVGVPGTSFSVVRLKRDVLRRSSIGLIYTRRSRVAASAGANDVYGLDGTFAFYENLAVNTYWARTETAEGGAPGTSYRAQLDYAGDRYGAQVERLVVGPDFRPEIGFVRRRDIRRSSAQLRFSPRPESELVRKLSWTGDFSYTENADGRLEGREWGGEFGIEFENSDQFAVRYHDTYEFLPVESRILGLSIPVGAYEYASTRAGFNFGRQRRVSGNVTVEHGSFYSGHKTTLSVSQGRFATTPQLSFEPTYQGNWVDLVEGASTTHLAGTRVTYTMTPTMFTSALLQYNTGSNTLAANVRLRWEYRPGSELFVVLNDERDTVTPGYPDLVNRSLVVKVNRLLRF